MSTISRFAPSPTGLLHVGNLRTAIFNYLIAQKTEGSFILRIDDTDQERSRQHFVEQIKQDLNWVGLNWDRLERQSDRLEDYGKAADTLREKGSLYECFETPEELELKRKKQLSMGKPPVYDRSALRLTETEKSDLRTNRKSHWRFKLDGSRVEWEDNILGPVSVDTASVSDPILIRGDGQFLYTIASVVDDINLRVNYVIRGADHVTNTATQIQLLNELGGEIPLYAHHSLLVGPDGQPLSKRLEGLSLCNLREKGIEPIALVSFLSQLGSSRFGELKDNINDIVGSFNIRDFGANHTKFDSELLDMASQKSLGRMRVQSISKYLDTVGVPDEMKFDFWEMARENVSKRSDLISLWQLCKYGVEPVILEEDIEFIASCKKFLPDTPRDHKSWSEWTQRIKKETNRSGKNLYLPLRRALTGTSQGPDMNKLFPLLQNIKL